MLALSLAQTKTNMHIHTRTQRTQNFNHRLIWLSKNTRFTLLSDEFNIDTIEEAEEVFLSCLQWHDDTFYFYFAEKRFLKRLQHNRSLLIERKKNKNLTFSKTSIEISFSTSFRIAHSAKIKTEANKKKIRLGQAMPRRVGSGRWVFETFQTMQKYYTENYAVP